MNRLPAQRLGSVVFVDASTFIYHFTGVSAECRELLTRCERADIEGVTSVTAIAEVTHRLLRIEAVQAGVVTPGNVAAKLRGKPAALRSLRIAFEQAARIPLMGIEVLGLDLRLLLLAADLRRQHGLMTNDSILAATALDAGIGYVATADPDFGRVTGLTACLPTDLS